MREVLKQLLESVELGAEVAFCQIIETRGSTPQKAGAAMLVRADGTQAGTLGGGCVESEVRQRAMRNIAAGRTTIETFQLDHDYGWDDGLICGGRMTIVAMPVTRSDNLSYFRELERLCHQAAGALQAIVIDPEQAGFPAGSAMLLDTRQELLATFPAGLVVDGTVPIDAHALAEGSVARAQVRSGMALVPLRSRCRLLVIGGGHVGQAVAALAARVDFDVWVYDDREDMVTQQRFPTAQHRIAGELETVLPQIEITPDTYCLIVTRGHHHDEQALFHVAERGARYVGMIGSRRKIRMIFDDLLRDGIAPEALARVHAPVGLDIGSQTVDEIAVSIVAELIAHRNCGGNVPARPKGVKVAV